MNQDDIDDWAQHPMTKQLKQLVENQLQELQEAKAHAYAPFDPQRTQEIFANLNGAEDAWDIAIELLNGNWEYVIEEDDEQSIGHIPPA